MGYIDIVRPTPNHNEQPVIYYNVYTAYNRCSYCSAVMTNYDKWTKIKMITV